MKPRLSETNNQKWKSLMIVDVPAKWQATTIQGEPESQTQTIELRLYLTASFYLNQSSSGPAGGWRVVISSGFLNSSQVLWTTVEG